jgi:hypothetical protein
MYQFRDRWAGNGELQGKFRTAEPEFETAPFDRSGTSACAIQGRAGGQPLAPTPLRPPDQRSATRAAGPDCGRTLGRVSCPTLIVWGRKAMSSPKPSAPDGAQHTAVPKDPAAAARQEPTNAPTIQDQDASGCKSAPNQDLARDWSYRIDSSPIISVLVGSPSAPIGTLLFSGFSTSNQGGDPRWSGVPVRC